MLTMDDIKYIKRMYECEGISIREIMRRTGYHYETVKKYIDMNDFNVDCQHFLIHFLFGHICKSILNWSHII